MNVLEEDVRKGVFRKGYLLYGEEDYLKDYHSRRAVSALTREGDTINLNRYDGTGFNLRELISQADTLPFFAEHRVILVRNSGLFKKGGDALADYLPSMPESTVLIFVEKEVDKRSRLYKAVKSCGALMEFVPLKEQALSDWAVKRLAREGKRIQASAMRLLLEHNGNDMYMISNEIEKLCSYTGDREGITLQDVEAVGIEQPEDHIFAMIDAAAMHDRKKALALYKDLVLQRQPPLRTLALIERHFLRLLSVRDLRDQGYDRQSIETKTGMRSFMLRPLLAQSEKFTIKEIRRVLRSCARADEAVKTGRMGDSLAVESVLIEAAGGQKAF